MRRLLSALAAVALLAACDPTIKKFEVLPEKVQCPANVKLAWEGDADGGRLAADQPVTPPLPDSVLKTGSLTAKVTKTTTFKFFYPSAAEREKTVVVENSTCGPTPMPMPACGDRTLTFTGTCFSSMSGPNYISLNVDVSVAPGALQNLTTDADFPLHVLHAGQEIALSAGGGPIFPLPSVPAAGDYTITVPGQAGQLVCASASPTSGSTEAPVVHLFVKPTCPK
jgi:hypothetical protein